MLPCYLSSTLGKCLPKSVLGGNAAGKGEGEPSSAPKDSGRSPAEFVFSDMGHQLQPMSPKMTWLFLWLAWKKKLQACEPS